MPGTRESARPMEREAMRPIRNRAVIVRIALTLSAGAAYGAAASGQTALLHLKGNTPGEMYGAICEEVSAGFVFSPNYELVVGVPDDDTNGTDAGRVDVRSATNGS